MFAVPSTHGRGSSSQMTSRSEQRTSKPAFINSMKNRTLRIPAGGGEVSSGLARKAREAGNYYRTEILPQPEDIPPRGERIRDQQLRTHGEESLWVHAVVLPPRLHLALAARALVHEHL